MDEPPGDTRRDYRIPDIAWLKGLCIIGVLLIHSQPLVHSLAYEYVISRAVLIFIVLFGVTSELWWRRHTAEPWRRTAAAWYRTRLVRLMIPLWGMLALWWLLVIALRSPIHVASHIVIATALGYMPWIGTGWFVTLALELVVLFPALRWCVHRVGGRVSMVAAAAMLVASYVYMYPVIYLMRFLLHDSGALRQGGGLSPFHFYYHWIFAPAYFFGAAAVRSERSRATQWRCSHGRSGARRRCSRPTTTLVSRRAPSEDHRSVPRSGVGRATATARSHVANTSPVHCPGRRTPGGQYEHGGA